MHRRFIIRQVSIKHGCKCKTASRSIFASMDYLKLTFSEVNESTQEILIAQLAALDFMGFEQKEHHLLAYIENENSLNKDYSELLEHHTCFKEVIPEVNWNAQWERDFEPIIIENQVAIRAHFHKPIDVVKHEIIVTPKMSFGTGHHATTQLMLEQMSQLDLKDKKVFDYGTGTGVLAIYAEMLGASNILANDIDPWSEENAKENVSRNKCSNIDVRLGGLESIPEQGFDCILANINLNVLRESMETLFNKLNKGGLGLILSGVLRDNREDIINIVESHSVDYQVFEKDKWLCLHVKY